MLIGQELVTLINAEQTDCYGQLMAYMTTRRAEKIDMLTAKVTVQQAVHQNYENDVQQANCMNNNHSNDYNNNNNKYSQFESNVYH